MNYIKHGLRIQQLPVAYVCTKLHHQGRDYGNSPNNYCEGKNQSKQKTNVRTEAVAMH